MVRKIGNVHPSGNGMNGNIFDTDGKSPCLTTNKGEGMKIGRMTGVRFTKDGAFPFKEGGGGLSEYSTISYQTSKACAVTAEHSPKVLLSEKDEPKIEYRKLTVTECERLQTVPEGYTACVSKGQAYKMLGNGWTVDVIAHIFGFLAAEGRA